MDDIVERLRTPSDNEETMKVWDSIRSIIASGNRGSLPRDIFESILSNIDCEREEAADEIATLRSRCAALEKALEPFAKMVGNDNGDMTVSLSVNADDLINAYFVLRRAALTKAKGREPVDNPGGDRG